MNILLKFLNLKRIRLFLIDFLHMFYTSQIDDQNFDMVLSRKIDCIMALKEYECES